MRSASPARPEATFGAKPAKTARVLGRAWRRARSCQIVGPRHARPKRGLRVAPVPPRGGEFDRPRARAPDAMPGRDEATGALIEPSNIHRQRYQLAVQAIRRIQLLAHAGSARKRLAHRNSDTPEATASGGSFTTSTRYFGDGLATSSMPRQLCTASSTASCADASAPSCASRRSAPASGDARPITNAGPMPSSLLMGCSPFAPPSSRRDTPDEETNNWRAVCGKTARTVRRAGRQAFPTPIGWFRRACYPIA